MLMIHAESLKLSITTCFNLEFYKLVYLFRLICDATIEQKVGAQKR